MRAREVGVYWILQGPVCNVKGLEFSQLCNEEPLKSFSRKLTSLRSV